jgi:peptidoglycan hydrolase-like protein with peptidoglycan-binding domain
MESLAYLHLALAYEASTDTSPTLVLSNLKILMKLNQRKLISSTGLYFLSLAVSLTVLGMASQTLAMLQLQEGSQGPEVTRVQKRLQNLGYFNGNITSNFGSQTRDALLKFQQDRGLTADGVVGDETRAALFGGGSRRKPKNYHSVSYNPNFNSESGGSSLQQAQSVEDIRYLQQQLKDKGFYYGVIDGVYGSQTTQAVRDFQRAAGLPADGIAGTQTRLALDSYQGHGNIGYEYYPHGGYGWRSPSRNYVVVVPGSYDTLYRVNQHVSNAYVSKAKQGSYVNAGEFNKRDTAESRSKLLQSWGFDARVVYRP